MITNPQSGTNAHEIADGIYRINTPVDVPGGPAFNFNQYLLVDDEPLLFHTGRRQLLPVVRDAIASLMPVERVRHVGFSHTEADECGSLNLLLDVRRPRPHRIHGQPRWTSAPRPLLKLPSEQERRSVRRRHMRDLLDSCQLQHPLRAEYEALALGRDPRLAEGIASGERIAAEYRWRAPDGAGCPGAGGKSAPAS